MNRILSATLTIFFMVSSAHAAVIYSFQTIDNSADPTFNQLLGMNSAGTIVGYFGSGNAGHPNQGYKVAPPYGQAFFTNENFPGSVQTQVVGINNNALPTTVGFWVDGNANNFGFVNQNGIFTSVTDPNTPGLAPAVNQLLGVNDNNVAAGFYIDGAGNANGYLFNINTQLFTPIALPASFNAVGVTATGVNDAGVVSGFYLDKNGATHGFIENGGIFTSFDDPNTPLTQSGATNTMFLGLNNKDQLVGSFLDGNGIANGFVFDFLKNTWQTVNDPNGSTIAAFNVTGTTINGISDAGNIVGFYSDGTNVDGFEATAIPEPSSFGLAILGAVVLVVGASRRTKRSHRVAERETSAESL